MLTRGIPGIAGLWQCLGRETGGGQALTPGSQLRLIWTETLVKCATRQQPGKYLSPPVARGVMAEPEIVSCKIRINCRANRGDWNLTEGNVNWGTLFFSVQRYEARLLVCFWENRIYPSNLLPQYRSSWNYASYIRIKNKIKYSCSHPLCSPLFSLSVWTLSTLVPPPLKASWYHLAPWSPLAWLLADHMSVSAAHCVRL